MFEIDFRIKSAEQIVLKNCIGKKFDAVWHSEFNFVNATSEIVKLSIGGRVMFLYSFVEPTDYFGCQEDVAIWTIEEIEYPSVMQKNFIETPIDEIITDIIIVDDHQKLYFEGEQTYSGHTIRGIVFILESGREIAFEKAVWFSEDIYITKGYNLAQSFQSIYDFQKEWEDSNGYFASAERETISLKDS